MLPFLKKPSVVKQCMVSLENWKIDVVFLNLEFCFNEYTFSSPPYYEAQFKRKMRVFVCVCVSMCLLVYLCVCLCICMCISKCVYMYTRMCV